MQIKQKLALEILRLSPDAIIVLDRFQNIVVFNQSAERIFGYSAEEVLGSSVSILIPEQYREAHRRYVDDFSSEQGRFVEMGQRRTIYGLRKNGEVFPAEASISELPVNGDKYWTAVFRDISERIRQEHELRKANSDFRLLLEAVGEGIFKLDTEGRCSLINPVGAGLLGYSSPEELLGRDMHQLIQHCRSDRSPFPRQQSRILQTLHTGHQLHVTDEVFWKADGSRMAVEYRAHPIREDGRVVGVVVTFNDITAQKELSERYAFMAQHDMLTKLANRVLFQDRLESALARAKRYQQGFAILYIDLDRFKDINDRFGHASGDRVLEAVAHGMREAVRETDTVARLGGDEFAVIVEHTTSKEDLSGIADKLCRSIEQASRSMQWPTVGASIGIVIYPDHADTIQQLLRQADRAMYRAKNSDLNYCFADQSVSSDSGLE